ncbi:MAG: flagellar export protein FliJ [Proteobacteria bacterium]|nr:flagellar export protein FliJ [Pseudomonadota bacterium]
MKRFSFRLEKVLRYRKYLEKKAQKKLSDTLYEYQNMENSIKEIENKQIKLSDKCSEEKRRGIEVLRYQRYNLYFKKLNDDQEKECLALKETEEAVQLHRNLLKKELIRKKMLEKLKEIQSSRYMLYAEKDEQKQSDEAVIVRAERVI